MTTDTHSQMRPKNRMNVSPKPTTNMGMNTPNRMNRSSRWSDSASMRGRRSTPHATQRAIPARNAKRMLPRSCRKRSAR